MTSCESNVTQLAAAAIDADNRISNGITANNKALDETKLLAETAKEAYNRMNELEVRMRGLNEGITELGVTWRSQIELLEPGFDAHVASRCQKFDADLLELQGSLIAKSESLRNELLVWSKGVDAQVLAGGGVPPGLGGKGGGGKGRLDKKDLSVWKLEDNVEKLKFRHWVEAVENNLEQLQGWDRASEVLDRVRRKETEIDQNALNEIIDEAYDAVEAAGESRMDRSAYEFVSASRMLHTFLLNKINADMHERTTMIENKNGFELYRVIYQSVDPIASNALFACDQAIMQISHEHAGKIKSLKDLYQFRMLLKRKVAEYKKIIGQEPDMNMPKNILFSCMDLGSKQHIANFALDRPKFDKDGKPIPMYKIFCEDIDKRYKLQYGTLELKPRKDHDDPMVLHAVGAGEAEGQAPAAAAEPAGNDAALDAFGGKGGKGKGDGRCRTCNGEGHFARDCPPVEPVSPQAIECHGCHGKGHTKAQCPTANPQLKVYQQQKGWDSGGRRKEGWWKRQGIGLSGLGRQQ